MDSTFVRFQLGSGFSSKSNRLLNKAIAEEAFKEYDEYGFNQTFDEVHRRGGFALDEIISLLYSRIKRLEGDERISYAFYMKVFSEEKTK